jgi:hypothetical protein
VNARRAGRRAMWSAVGAVTVASLLLSSSSAGRHDARNTSMPTGTISLVGTEDSRVVYLIAVSSGAVRQIRAPDALLGGKADLSSASPRIAAAGIRGIWTFSRRGHHSRRVLPVSGSVRFLPYVVDWSPDGQRVAFARASGLFVLTLRSGRARRVVSDSDIHTPEWSPDGDAIVYVRDNEPSAGDGSIEIISLDGTRRDPITRGLFPSVSPDGLRIAFARRDGVYVTALRGGKAVRVVARASHPVWSPDGRYLGFTRHVACGDSGCIGRTFVTRADGYGEARPVGPRIFDIGQLSWAR